MTLRTAKRVQGSLNKLVDLACTVFGFGSRNEMVRCWSKVISESPGLMDDIKTPTTPLGAHFRSQLEPILGELMPDPGQAYDENFAEKIFRAMSDDEAGVNLWRSLPEDAGTPVIAIFRGLAEFLTIYVRRDLASTASGIPHHRGGGRPAYRWPDDDTCRKVCERFNLLHGAKGRAKMDVYEEIRKEYGISSGRMVRRIVARRAEYLGSDPAAVAPGRSAAEGAIPPQSTVKTC